jgi:hypothetical protein
MVPVQKQTARGLELELTVCRHRGDKLICDLRVRNLVEDREYLLLGQAYETVTRAVDDRGNVYPAGQVQLGDQVGTQYVKTVLPYNVPVIGRITFTSVPEDVAKLSLLEIRFSEDWSTRAAGAKFQLRTVTVN